MRLCLHDVFGSRETDWFRNKHEKVCGPESHHPLYILGGPSYTELGKWLGHGSAECGKPEAPCRDRT